MTGVSRELVKNCALGAAAYDVNDFDPITGQLLEIAKHLAIDGNKVSIKAEQREGVSTLDINIELPTRASGKRKAA